MKPLNIAHRGGADLWPENTLAAFEGAIAIGADGAELDVHLSRDGELVVYHDEALKPEITRELDGAWLESTGPLLKTMSFDGLRAYDVGRLKPGTSYAARHPRQSPADGQRIRRCAKSSNSPRRGAGLRALDRVKTDLMRPHRGADPEALAEAAVALVRQESFAARTVFVSFDWRALKRAKALAPEIPAFATTLPLSWFGPGVRRPSTVPRRRSSSTRFGPRWRRARLGGRLRPCRQRLRARRREGARRGRLVPLPS